MPAKVHPVDQHYGVQYWGDGYFGINSKGHVSVCPSPDDERELDLQQLALDVRAAGLSWPVLIRFNGILQHRVRDLCNAFREVASDIGYAGDYRAIYPIKVNQQRSVVEQIVAAGDGCVGLEAGSKPELMAVLAASAPGSPIVCNGYKDAEYIRLALIGRQLGHDVYIVIEKPSELAMVVRESRDLNIEPLLGVRVRLSAIASGNWQNSGGAKSKFGLSAAQLVALLDQLRDADMLHCLTLLHSHIGSQIPDIADIGRGVSEAARYFVELSKAGAPLKVLDVGGGLGVDYEGSSSKHFCSANYDLQAYAREVLGPIAQQCQAHGLQAPTVFSESGRALTAHHAVLVTQVIERESMSLAADVATDELAALVVPLAQMYRDIDQQSPLLGWQGVNHQYERIQQAFEQGELDLQQRAMAEELFYATAIKVRERLRPTARRHRELLDELNEMLADRVFCNFSLFQSIPDAWAIEQIFPVMPLQGLDQTDTRPALVHDLTCDSDGCIHHYVDRDGVESALMLPASDEGPTLLGIFLVGAYQEILGDMHNLFGDTDAVNVEYDAAGGYRLADAERGDSVDELLRYVHFEPQQMLERYRQKLAQNKITGKALDTCFRELKAGLHGTTYLTD